MEQITGIVDDIQNKGLGKGSGIVVNGVKYGAYDPDKTGLGSLQVGQEVRLTYKQQNQYKNIQGSVVPTGASGTAQTMPVASASAPAKSSGGGYSRGSFPIGALDGQRSIIRQNAVTNANTYLSNFGGTKGEAVTLDDLIAVARQIEAYTTGDLDAQEVESAMERLANPDQTH